MTDHAPEAGRLPQRDPEDQAGQAGGEPAQQPLQLLPPLAGRAPVADHLPGQGHQQAQRQRHEEHVLQHVPPARRVRAVVQGQQVAAGVHADVVADDGVDRDDVGAAHPHQAHGQVQPQHPAQPRGRQRAVGEDQDGQPDQDDKEGPAGLGEHGHPPQRQRAVADPVGGDRVQAAVVAERPGDDQAEEAPSERVARLPPGHDEAHHAEGGEGPPRRAAGAGVHAHVRQAGERPLGGEQGHHDSAEHQRGGGRGQPEAAARLGLTGLSLLIERTLRPERSGNVTAQRRRCKSLLLASSPGTARQRPPRRRGSQAYAWPGKCYRSYVCFDREAAR